MPSGGLGLGYRTPSTIVNICEISSIAFTAFLQPLSAYMHKHPACSCSLSTFQQGETSVDGQFSTSWGSHGVFR